MKKFIKITLFTIILFLVGIIKVNAQDNVSITNVELEEKSEYVIINEEVSLENNKITSNINFYDEGDYVIYKLTIKNNDDKDYKIEDILDDNSSEYLSFEYDYEDGVLGAKSEKEVLLKITYVSLLPYDAELSPEHTFNATTEVNISFKLTDYVKNPSTLDRIGKQSFTVILCVLLLFAFVKLRKSKFLYVLVLGLFLIPIGTNAEREITFNIQLNNTIEASVNFLAQNWKSKISGEYSKVEFVKRASFPTDAVDVSKEQDNSIKAWIEDGTLYFGSRYRIFFPENSEALFFNLGIIEINFNNRVDTTFVKNMTGMLNKNNFEEIDVSSFRTGNVTNMTATFGQNLNLKKLDLSTFDMSNVTNINSMFTTCPALEELIIDDWNLSSLIYGNGSAFEFTYALKTISAKNLIFPVNASSLFRNNSYSGTGSLESIDLTGSDVSNTTSLYAMFEDQHHLKEIKGIEDWDTSNVTSIAYFFTRTGRDIDGGVISLDLSNWDVSNVTEMDMIFEDFALSADEVYLTINGWENTHVTSLYDAFRSIGSASNIVKINIDGFNFSEVTTLEYGFYGIGYSADEVEIIISNVSMPKLSRLVEAFQSIGQRANKVTIDLEYFYVPNIQNTDRTFEYTGDYANYVNVTLKNWDMSNCLSSFGMFYYFASSAKEEVNLTLENIDLSSATNMNMMFYTAARNPKVYNFNFINVDTSSVQSMDYFLCYSGQQSEEWTLNGIGSLDLRNVTSMKGFLEQISNTTRGSAREIETLDIYEADISSMFAYTTKIKGSINLHKNPTSYSFAFSGIATSDDSEFIVNYTEDVTNIDNIINTKSENSKVYKGNLIEN